MNNTSVRAMLVIALLAMPASAFAGTWATMAPLPMAVYGRAVALDGSVYVVGSVNGSVAAPTQIYDPSTNTWSEGASVGVISAGALGGYDGKLYYANGCMYTDCNLPTDQLLIYDPVTNTWTSGAPAPTSRGDVAGTFVNGKFYVTAGLHDSGGYGGFNTQLDIYDPSADTWSSGAPIPFGRRGASAVALDGKLYVIGGQTRTGPVDRVDVYDPGTNTWSTDTPLPLGLSAFAASVMNGKIHVIGGQTNIFMPVATDAQYVFDPATHEWSTDTALPTPRWGTPSATVGYSMYVMGGAENGGTLSTANEAFTELPVPADKMQCMKGNWRDYTDGNGQPFKNQGLCVRYTTAQ